MFIDKQRLHCLTCKNYRKEIRSKSKGQFVCCKWFIDNVVCGGHKNTRNCPLRK